MNNKDFLNWIADRLVNVYGESENIDFIIKLRSIPNSQKYIKEDLIMDTKRIVKIATYVVSAIALVSLVNVAPVQVGVLAVSALANIFYVEK